jgi:cytochrome c-type biogenesis protein CcmH/NrfF
MAMRQTGFSPVRTGMSLGLFLVIAAYNVIASASEPPLTIREVARDLACPCQCPLILQDCNMSCGLRWKEEIGQKIAEGKSKQEITKYFIAKYGEGARLTPLQKINGKIYQYTRGFGTMEWVILVSGVLIWMLLMFFMVYFLVNKYLRREKVI